LVSTLGVHELLNLLVGNFDVVFVFLIAVFIHLIFSFLLLLLHLHLVTELSILIVVIELLVNFFAFKLVSKFVVDYLLFTLPININLLIIALLLHIFKLSLVHIHMCL